MNAHEPLNGGHLNEDVLIDALYGVANAGVEEHLRQCTACATRRDELEEKRSASRTLVDAPPAVWAEQRRNVYQRIEHPSLSDRTSRWATPALAGIAACILAIAVFMNHPMTPADQAQPTETSAEHTAPASVPVALSDIQLYTDVYAMEQSFVPSASASLGVLFEQPDSGSRSSDSGRIVEQ